MSILSNFGFNWKLQHMINSLMQQKHAHTILHWMQMTFSWNYTSIIGVYTCTDQTL